MSSNSSLGIEPYGSPPRLGHEACLALWYAVLLTGREDYLRVGNSDQAKEARRKGKAFLSNHNGAFEDICDVLGLDWRYVSACLMEPQGSVGGQHSRQAIRSNPQQRPVRVSWEERECEICGATYEPCRPHQRTCGGGECKHERKLRRAAWYRKHNKPVARRRK